MDKCIFSYFSVVVYTAKSLYICLHTYTKYGIYMQKGGRLVLSGIFMPLISLTPTRRSLIDFLQSIQYTYAAALMTRLYIYTLTPNDFPLSAWLCIHTQSLWLPSYTVKCPLPCLHTYHTHNSQEPFHPRRFVVMTLYNQWWQREHETSGARPRCARLGSCLWHPSHQGCVSWHRLPGWFRTLL